MWNIRRWCSSVRSFVLSLFRPTTLTRALPFCADVVVSLFGEETERRERRVRFSRIRPVPSLPPSFVHFLVEDDDVETVSPTLCCRRRRRRLWRPDFWLWGRAAGRAAASSAAAAASFQAPQPPSLPPARRIWTRPGAVGLYLGERPSPTERKNDSRNVRKVSQMDERTDRPPFRIHSGIEMFRLRAAIVALLMAPHSHVFTASPLLLLQRTKFRGNNRSQRRRRQRQRRPAGGFNFFRVGGPGRALAPWVATHSPMSRGRTESGRV